ncbi:hypothetical protein SACS_1003 [Parasaccharibacter apium]|uniref:Uncharacterized protein n=1 Tax=Parasaccharibacter apium TaxID=1510841 RepID=A0A7U7J119_9PROT|nr:hypothetical protein SACS_1003 [Parasaccharibacter apium]
MRERLVCTSIPALHARHTGGAFMKKPAMPAMRATRHHAGRRDYRVILSPRIPTANA